MRRRRRLLLIAACVAGLVSVGGIAGATLVRSPAQIAADTQAPAPSVITAPVVHQVLSRTVVLRGTFSDGRTISATPTSLANVPKDAGGTRLVVTEVLVHAGGAARAGRPLIEYSGRPVFALPGAIPAYRDLGPNDSGKDVVQLQRGLRSLGYGTGADPAGTFGGGTQRALKRLYSAMGYDAPRSDRVPGGVMLPSSEVVFVPSLPARVVSVPVAVGDDVKGPVVTLARGGMELTGAMDPADEGLVKAGMIATVLSETTGDTAHATVAGVGKLTTAKAGAENNGAEAGGGGADGGAYIPLQIKPDKSWPVAFDGQDVRITVTAAATAGAVFAVPEAAISSGADARTSVSVVGAGGKQRVVPVTTGVSADGMVQVTPSNHGLSAGDRVVVGQ
ncbi:peptidoglycan-binding domain-containing protein [Actinacidiphila paucisporea]|uniref:peptidoglycan-binding domain-containing protein n=1 Tax=Actinacidiphila paucisporea TaxID=310782 RepID=UPI001F468FC3|nr:peptidoglycan-binding domain-containing protein [Actinacidiphila paucisporea]